jgi:hypothetical protein
MYYTGCEMQLLNKKIQSSSDESGSDDDEKVKFTVYNKNAYSIYKNHISKSTSDHSLMFSPKGKKMVLKLTKDYSNWLSFGVASKELMKYKQFDWNSSSDHQVK